MMVDLGAGTIDLAVLSRGGLLHASTLRVGGGEMDQAIVRYLRQERSVEVGEGTAEAAKIELGSAHSPSSQRVMEIGGRNLTTMLPEVISVTSEEVRAAIDPVLKEIQRGVRSALEALPTEASVDLLETGMTLSGGGAQLAGLPEQLGREVGLKVQVASDPRSAVVLGAGRLLEQDSAVSGLEAAGGRKSSGLSTTEAALAEEGNS
jgi:rod shape-determining protein MreB